MNCEIINGTFEYSITYIKFENNIYTFDFNGQEMHSNNLNYIQHVIDNLEYCIETSSIYGENIERFYIHKNHIWMDIKTNEGKKYSTTICGYKRRIAARIKFMQTVDKNGDFLLDTYIDAKIKVNIQYKCGHVHSIIPNSYLKPTTKGCPICGHKIIVPYVNDCYTLRPDLLKYFTDKNDAVGMPVNDRKKRLYKCPICGEEKYDYLGNISMFGFSCRNCSDGFSYAEKLMRNLLKSLLEKYEYHARPIWCYYELDGEFHQGEYDFMLEDKKMIIEMDGGFHFKECGSRYYKENNPIVDKIKDELAEKNGYHVVRVNCFYKKNNMRYDYIKNSIIDKLSGIFDFSKVDWDYIDYISLNSVVFTVCDLWNDGYTTQEIANKLDINHTSIIEYLKKGNKIGKCIYSKELSNLRQAKNISKKYYVYAKAINKNTGETIGVFYDIDNFIYNYMKTTGDKLNKQSIRNILFDKGRNSSTKGLVFEIIDELEYNCIIKDNSLINDIVDVNIPIVMSNVDYSHLYNEAKESINKNEKH